MTLTEKERNSDVWAKIKAELIRRKQSLLEKLSVDMDEAQTNKLRGRIAECSRMLALDTVEPEPQEFDDSF